MRKFIGFGELSIKLLFPFFTSISRNFRLILFNILDISSKLKNYPFLITIFMFFSEILGGLLELIVCLKQKPMPRKTSNEETIHTISQFNRIPFGEDRPNQLTIKSVSILFLMVLIGIIETNTPVVISQFNPRDNITDLRFQLKIIQIFFISALSIKILNSPLYKHQYCSIGIIVVGIFFLLYYSFQKYEIEWYWILTLIIDYCLVSLLKVCEKWLMHKKYFSPYRILLYEGTIGFLISVIIEITLSLVPCPKIWHCVGQTVIENSFEIFKAFDYEMFLYIFFYVLFVGNIVLWSVLTNKYFTPTHTVISDIFSSFLYWAINFYYKSDPVEFIVMNLIGFIVIMFGALWYTEVIIIYVFGLSDNTKVEIRQRGKMNYLESIEATIMEENENEGVLDNNIKYNI